MEKAAFLEAHVFTDLKKIENKSTQEDIHLFSETDFPDDEGVLCRRVDVSVLHICCQA